MFAQLSRRAAVSSRVQTNVRTKFTKAAMPGRGLDKQVLERQVQLLSRVQSRTPTRSSHSVTPSGPFPWETKITPPPKRQPGSDSAEERDSEDARAALADILQEASRQKALRKAKAKEDLMEKRAAAAKAREAENAAMINEAVKIAVSKAEALPPRTATELAQLQQEYGVKKRLLLRAIATLQAAKGSTLKLQLGQAILKRNVTTSALMREWDANGDGDLTRMEFTEAIQRSLKIDTTREQVRGALCMYPYLSNALTLVYESLSSRALYQCLQISDLFDMFDEDLSGSVTIIECKSLAATSVFHPPRSPVCSHSSHANCQPESPVSVSYMLS